MAVGVAELDGDLAAGPAPTFEIDLDAVLPQVITGAQDLIERADLKGDMVQFDILGRRRQRPDERNTVMVRVAAQKAMPPGTISSG
jgi:hypothetical protein